MTEHTDGLRIEPISKAHTRNSFCCGKPQLDDYLRLYARQNDKRNIAKTFVAVDAAQRVVSYYSLSAAKVEFAELPEALKRQLPEYPVPAALIARLAVDSSCHAQGLGARLLIDALQRILSAANEIAVKVVLVDALDEGARRFYRHYGFLELPDQDFKLFLPIETVTQLF